MKKMATWVVFFLASHTWANTAPTNASEALVSAFWAADVSGYKKAQQQLVNAANGDVKILYKWFEQGPVYRADVLRGVFERHRTANGGVRFPYVVVVPETYDARQPIAVEFMLHGGVTRPSWRAGGKWWNEGKHYEAYRQRDQITVFPAAWRDAVWWSDDQADNLVSILRTLKANYNIDDNRVYLSGASDGGTGTYFYAFKQPSEWAAFLPYIGHVAVLTLKDEPRVARLDVENLMNSALFIVNGERDPLYPAKSVAPFIALLEKAKINHVYTVIKEGGHNLTWLDELQPNIAAFKALQVRDPLPEKLRWMTDRVDRYQRIHWLRVDKLAQRNAPGWVSARRNGNTFTLLTEDVARFTLLLNPEEVDFNQPVVVALNGEIIFRGSVSQDVEVLFTWAKNRDKTQLFTAELTLP